jgi:hypothetical protein
MPRRIPSGAGPSLSVDASAAQANERDELFVILLDAWAGICEQRRFTRGAFARRGSSPLRTGFERADRVCAATALALSVAARTGATVDSERDVIATLGASRLGKLACVLVATWMHIDRRSMPKALDLLLRTEGRDDLLLDLAASILIVCDHSANHAQTLTAFERALAFLAYQDNDAE